MDTGDFQAKLSELLGSGSKQTYAKGQLIQFDDTVPKLSIVESGYIKRYFITTDGDQSIQSIYGPGEIFPLTPVFQQLFNMPLHTSDDALYYEAITPITVQSVTIEQLLSAADQDKDLYRELMYVCGIRLHSNIQRLENMSLKAVENRLAHQLVYFAEKFGTKTEHGIEIQLPLTHQTLAYVLNVARETVSVNMQRLEEKQLISSHPHVVVTDIDGLRVVAST